MNTKLFNFNPKNLYSLFLGMFAVVLISCEQDPSSLGSNLLPENIGYRYDTSVAMRGNVFEDEPFITSNLSSYSIGIIEDSYFGMQKSEYIGQFLPSNFDTTIVQHNIDSAFLYLLVDSIYGFQDQIQYKVYEIENEINDDGEYYFDTDISSFYTEQNLISLQGQFLGDTLYKIRLNNSFIDSLMSVEDTIYKNSLYFLSKFNGLAIIPEITGGIGGMTHFNVSSSETKIVLHYNDSLSFYYNLFAGQRFAKYTTDFSNSESNVYLSNSESENDNLLFVQGLNGLKSNITFTNIDSLFESDSAYSVLNAELFVPIFKDENFELFPPPNNLYLRYQYEDTLYAYIKDYYDSRNNKGVFDGSYDSENNYYRFIVPKHLMYILNRDIENHEIGLNLVSPGYPHRVILKSGENIKLKVTYTKH